MNNTVSWGRRILLGLRSRTYRLFVSGLLVVVPAGITLFVLKLFYDLTAGYLARIIVRFIDPIPTFLSPLISVLFLALLVYGMGILAEAVLGKKAIAFLESLVQRVPYIKAIYGASKQIVQSLFSINRHSEVKTPVIIEFPSPGMKCVGFALGRIQFNDGRVFYRVFVPTTPNVTIGLFQLVAPKDVFLCPLTLEEAVTLVVSGGILGPDHMMLTRASLIPPEQVHMHNSPSDDDWDDDAE